MEIAVSRQGNLAVINHEKFQIKFNLAKGTWDYIDGTGQTIIKNGCTQITLHDGSTVSTEDAGTREFFTEPLPTVARGLVPRGRSAVQDARQIRFSYEATEKGIRLNTYLNCFPDAPYIVLRVGVENLEPVPIELDSVTLLGISTNRGAVQLGGKPSAYHLFTNTPPTFPGGCRKLYDGFRLSETEASHPCQSGILHDTDSQRALVFGFLTTEKWWPQVQVGHQVVGKESPGINRWSLYHRCEQHPCQAGEEVTSDAVYLNFTDRAAAAYRDYTELVAAQNGAQTTRQVVGAWHLLDLVDASAENTSPNANVILEQADRLAESPLFHPHCPGGIEYIQIDATETNADSDADSASVVIDNVKDGTVDISAGKPAEMTAFRRNSKATVSAPEMHAERPAYMQKIVNHIHAKGFKAAIRINPFCAALDSELLQRYPDCCLQVLEPDGKRFFRPTGGNKRGGAGRQHNRPNRGSDARSRNAPTAVLLPGSGNAKVALLDVSHPDAQAHVRLQVQRIVAEWGCELIQADFSAYTTVLSSPHNVTWYDNTLTSVQLYRLAVQVLKEAVADASPTTEVLLAGYNVIAAPCIGSFALNSPLAGQVAGADAANESRPWHHPNGTKHRMSRYAIHQSEHNTLWNHVFGELAVDEPRPVNEAIVEMTAAAISGGAVFCSDSLATLKPYRAELLAKLFPLTGAAAKPIGLYDEPFPRIWSLSVCRDAFGVDNRSWDISLPGLLDVVKPCSSPRDVAETWHLAAVFNWADHEDDVDFELDALGLPKSKDYLVHDFWMRQYLGTVSENVTLLNIPPRSVKLLCLREEQNVPQLLATDMHWTQGSVEILSAGWDRQNQSYLLVCKPLRQTEGTCFIHVPENYLPTGVSAYGSEYHYRWDKPICQVTFGPTKTLIHAHIQFAKTSGISRVSSL